MHKTCNGNIHKTHKLKYRSYKNTYISHKTTEAKQPRTAHFMLATQLLNLYFSDRLSSVYCLKWFEVSAKNARNVTVTFIYYYSTEGPQATYTVGKRTRNEKHM